MTEKKWQKFRICCRNCNSENTEIYFGRDMRINEESLLIRCHDCKNKEEIKIAFVIPQFIDKSVYIFDPEKNSGIPAGRRIR